MRGFDGAVVSVSHDRYLLDETVAEIAELDGGRIRMWQGNYSAYSVARELELQRQQQLYVTQQKEIARLEEAIRRFEDWARRVVDERHIKQARNKQRQIDRMEKIDRPVLERRRIALDLRPHARGGERVVALRGATVELGGTPILIGPNWRSCAASASESSVRTAPASACCCACSPGRSSRRGRARRRPVDPLRLPRAGPAPGRPDARRRSSWCAAPRRFPRERRCRA